MRPRPASRPGVRNDWVAAALAAGSGLAGVTAFPRFGWWPMAIVSIVGLTVAVHGRGVRASLGLGYLYGWAFFGPLLAWTGTYVGPVWLLLPFAPDWRWMLGRDDTSWYASLRLFRQPRPGDWAAVIARVADRLGAYLAGDGAATPPTVQ